MTKFCYYIPLKAGVIIISLLMIVGGVCATVKYSLKISSPEVNLFEYAGIIRSLPAYYGFMAIEASCGLFIVMFMNASKKLLIYSKITCAFTAFSFFYHIKIILDVSTSKPPILRDCNNQGESSDACNKSYNQGLVIVVTSGIISIFLSVYFSILVVFYARFRKEEEYVIGPPGQNRVSPTADRSNRSNRLTSQLASGPGGISTVDANTLMIMV